MPWGSATSEYFRREIEAPWFAYWLKDQGEGRFPEATVFDAGAQEWKRFDAWPAPGAVTTSLYFREDGGLSFDAPSAAKGFDAYVSDPAHPFPYRHRPIERTCDPRGSRWGPWMTEDQASWTAGPMCSPTRRSRSTGTRRPSCPTFDNLPILIRRASVPR